MDHIYPTKDYKLYKIKDEVEKLSDSILTSEMPTSFYEISSTIGVSQEKLSKLSVEICKSYEDYGDETSDNAPRPFSSFPKAALELNCVNSLREGDFTFKEPRVKNVVQYRDKTEDKQTFADVDEFRDSVITVRFYEPFKYTPSMKNHPRFHQEYHVLGSNFLSDLRDKFYCQCNFGPFFDISDSQKVSNLPAPNSGFFFIHDTFYNDTRSPVNVDYSEVILQWYKRFDYVRKFKTGIMEETKFEDLEIRFGYPCVYQHHGACEHIFCITSVDLLDSSDSLIRSKYPTLSNSSRKRSTLCDICAQIEAAYLVTNCALHVKDPMRICESCFFSFHYESDGVTRTCNFSAYQLYPTRPENTNLIWVKVE